MLTAAYAILGLKLVGGQLELAPDAFASDRELRLLKVTYRGRQLAPPKNRERVASPSLTS
jgi:hypothetical protein